MVHNPTCEIMLLSDRGSDYILLYSIVTYARNVEEGEEYDRADVEPDGDPAANHALGDGVARLQK